MSLKQKRRCCSVDNKYFSIHAYSSDVTVVTSMKGMSQVKMVSPNILARFSEISRMAGKEANIRVWTSPFLGTKMATHPKVG